MLPTQTDMSTLILNETPISWFKIDHVFEDEFQSYPEKIRDMYQYCSDTRTYTLPESEWLNWRKHGPMYFDSSDPAYITTAVGGSDVGVLFDGSELSKQIHLYDDQHGSPYKAAIELFYEKTEQEFTLKEPVNKEVFWTGHNLEPSIRDLFEHVYKAAHPEDSVKVINDTHMYQCGRKNPDGTLSYPFVLCDLDGIVEINGLQGIIECKTCNFTSEDYPLWKQGIVPLKYYLQVCYYMACVNMPYAYIICRWGLQPTDCCYIYIERNFDIENAILSMVEKFVLCVETGQEPDVCGQNIDRIVTYWRKKMGPYKTISTPIQLDESYEPVIKQIGGINNEIIQLTKRIKELNEEKGALLVSKIFPITQDSNYVCVDKPSYQLQLKLRKSSSKFQLDLQKLSIEQPLLYERYCSEEFNEKLFMQEQKTIAAQYSIPLLTDAMKNFAEVKIVKKGEQ